MRDGTSAHERGAGPARRTRTRRAAQPVRRPSAGVHPAVIEATKAIGQLGGDHARAREAVDELVRLGHAPTTVTINALIRCHVEAGRAEAAEHLIGEMRTTWQLAPDAFSYNLVLRAYSLARREADAERVLACACAARVDDACSYATMLSAALAPKRASQLLAQMDARGVPPDAIALHAAMRVYERAAMGDACEALAARLPAGGASRFTFASVAKAWTNAAEPERAEAALRTALRRGLADSILYAIVADGYACACPPRVADVERLVAEAIGTCAPGRLSLSLFHALLKAHARERAPRAQVVRELGEMLDAHGIRPDVATACAAAELLCNAGLPREALAHVTEARRGGIVPDARLWNILIHGYARCRCIRTSGVCNCEPCTCSSPDQALRLLRQMQAQGLPPDSITLNTLVASFCRAGRLPDAVHLLDSVLLVAPGPTGPAGETAGGAPQLVTLAAVELLLRLSLIHI